MLWAALLWIGACLLLSTWMRRHAPGLAPGKELLSEALQRVLPQTQCTQCGYSGCAPYAAAVAAGESIHRCPPGGAAGAQALARCVAAAPTTPPFEAAQPAPLQAVIREAECIGCARCLPACPVDAILGAPAQMHTVLSTQCTGCGLCVEPCPVDCIDMLAVAQTNGEDKALQRPAPTASPPGLPPSNAAPSCIDMLAVAQTNGEDKALQRPARTASSPGLPPSDAAPIWQATLPDGDIPAPGSELAAPTFFSAKAPFPCIRCGRCVEACPAQLAPRELLVHAARGDVAEADAGGLFACLECGACEAVCPSRIPLLAELRSAKQEAAQWSQARRSADIWRRRHQGHATRQLRRLRRNPAPAPKTEQQRRLEIRAAMQRELARRSDNTQASRRDSS